MSAVLAINDIEPVANLLERVQSVQRAIRDLHDAYEDNADYYVAVSTREGGRDVPVAYSHGLSHWVVLQGLAAMERELLQQLRAKDIDVESALPMQETDRRASIPDPFKN